MEREMKVKTNELTGAALDWAVAKCEGLDIEFEDPRDPWLTLDGIAHQPLHSYTPSTDWAQGGPIIEREGICVFLRSPHWPKNNRWSARQENDASLGPTPLIAAMRCYVASKLGEDIDIPEELK
jgi:hypothetical protein